MKYTVLVERVLGVALTPAQHALCSVAFDGLDPCDLEGEARELARTLFGDIDRVPPLAREALVAVCGARGGKSYVLCALRGVHLALTVPLDTLAPGEVAVGIIVAPDMRLARQTLRFASGALRDSELASMVVKEGADGFTLRRSDGREVAISCLPATRGGSALRGRSLVFAALDEACFFRDADFVVNDEELFRAVAPRILPGGQIILASTPWTETGLTWKLFDANHGDPQTALAAHAPTLLLRPDKRTRGIIDRERQLDPLNAEREFDAVFMGGGADAFFDPVALRAAADLQPLDEKGAHHGAGCDFAFRSDHSACAIVRRQGDHYELVEWDEQRPAKGQPLKPSEVVATFAAVVNRHGINSVAADAHYLESVREHLSEHKLDVDEAPAGQTGKADTYVAVRQLLREKRLRIPANARRITQQLTNIVAKPLAGGGLSISSPRRRGAGHGDLVSALVLAVWSAERFSRHFEIHVPNVAPDIGFRDFGGRGFG